MSFRHTILNGGIWLTGVSACRRALGACSVWLCCAWMVLFQSVATQASTFEVSRTQDAAGGILGSASYQSVVAACQGQPASLNGSERFLNNAGFICTLDFLDGYRFGTVAATCDGGGGPLAGASCRRYAAVSQGQSVGVFTSGHYVNYAGFLCGTDILDSPLVGAFQAYDGRGVTNEVTDGALLDGEVEVNFTIYHQMGMKDATYDLFGPEGETISIGQSFGGFKSTNQYGLRCGIFTAAVSRAYPATLGTYSARVSALSLNRVRLTNCAVHKPSLNMSGARLKNSFSVIDDDVAGPELAVTSIAGSGTGGYTTGGGEVLFYDFGTDSGAPNLQPARMFLSIQSVSDMQVNGGTPDGAAGVAGAALSDNGWTGGDNYWEFTVAMLPGYLLDLQKIAFASRSTGTGPSAWALRSSQDGYSAVLASGMLATNANWETITADLVSSESESPVTYRLYGSGASSGTGTWRIDNLALTGSVASASGAFIVTDSDLNTNGVGFHVGVQDAGSGIYGIAHATHRPTWSLASPAGATNGGNSFGTGPGDGGAKDAAATLAATGGFAKADIVLGVYTVGVQAVDYDDDRPDDHQSASTSQTLTVGDDDTGCPKFSVDRGNYLLFDGVSAGSEANAVTDGMLTNGLSISNRVYDTQSGILATGVQFCVQDPEGWDSGPVDFSVRPANGGAKTNQFLDASATTVAIEDYDIQLTNGNGRALGVWTCTFYAVDYDDDRLDDGAATNASFQMYVVDDDKWGPRITNIAASGVSTGVLIATGFEALDGWSGHDGTNWTHEAHDGLWTAVSTYVNSFNGRGPEGTTVGYNAGFNAADDILQLPPLDQPGWVTVWARNSGTNGTAEWILERLDGESWTSLGTRSVAGTSYSEQAWLVDETNGAVSLRLRMTAASGSIYFDDLVVVPYRPWSRETVGVSWAEATDETTGDSGLGEYRQISAGSPPPLWSTNGVSLGLVQSCSFEASRDVQGIVTGYVFAVDGDMDRGVRDRAMGLAIPVIARLDITPPTMVPMMAEGATTEGVDDPTTQFDLFWDSNSVGPDDPGRSDVYPTWTNGNRNLFSPWKTYKIYYGPYDPADVPAGDPGHGNGNAYIYTNFIVSGAYSNDPAWKCVESTNVIADPAVAGLTYEALGSAATNRIRLYDLDFDQHYAVVMVGVDEVGNEGPAGPESWATNNTVRFSLIRGKTMDKCAARAAFPGCNTLSNTNADIAAALYWLAGGTTNAQGVYTSVSKDYDLIYWDSDRFQERTNNNWELLGTVRTNWFVDDGGQFRPRGQIRFFRASYRDRWKTTRMDGTNVVPQRPLASEEVYALHNVVLSGGQNFVALHGVPYTNTFQGVFGGLENFPGGLSALPTAGSTLVEFYSPGPNAPVADAYWLNSDGRWIQLNGGDVTTNLQTTDFFNRGFSIQLPNPVPTNYATTTAIDNTRVDTNGAPLVVPAMVWSPIMQVPTNQAGFSQQISCGMRSGRVSTAVYNMVALRLPVQAHPREMRLLESGFVPGPASTGDQIYTINTATKSVLSGSTIYCDANLVWRFVASNALVPDGYFKPNDVIVIVSRNGGVGQSWTWTYRPDQFYDLPTRWMGN